MAQNYVYSHYQGGTVAEEVLWMNYPEPWELHDYQFVGKGFRERERIKRKIKRWQDRLVKIDVTERSALMQSIQQTRFSPGNNVINGDTAGAIAIYDDAGSGIDNGNF